MVNFLILYIFFLEKKFLQLCQKLQNLVRKTQGILGIKLGEKRIFIGIRILMCLECIYYVYYGILCKMYSSYPFKNFIQMN
jgi:hypothetical protein